MGLILDSSLLIAAERQGQNARQVVERICATAGYSEIALSVITLLELAHGAARADTPQRRSTRNQFIDEVLTAIPIHPIAAAIALRAGKIDGECQSRGIRIPLSDLLIGVTALELGFDVATTNLRHFHLI